MFRKLFGKGLHFLSKPKKSGMMALSVWLYLCSNKFRLDTGEAVDEKPSKASVEYLKQLEEENMKKLVDIEVCSVNDIAEGKIYPVQVENQDGTQYMILIARVAGKLFATGGQCPHREPFEEAGTRYLLNQSVCFNEKFYCQHHGCAFNFRTGEVEYGPVRYNLPRFHVAENKGRVVLTHPKKIPKSVRPVMTQKDSYDLRKVVILGNDHAATIGCIDGLRQYGYSGNIDVIDFIGQQPYRKDYLHKSIIDLRLRKEAPKQPTGQNEEETKFKKGSKDKKQCSVEQIDKLLEEKIYSKLLYEKKMWYQIHGVDFTYSPHGYRIINKRFYPFLSFFDNTKIEFDALLAATDILPKYKAEDAICRWPNAFAPFRDKIQHRKMLRYFNQYQINSMLILGLNQYTLEFLNRYVEVFPKTKITVVDHHPINEIMDLYGFDLGKELLNQYTKHGVEFYIKIDEKQFTIKRNTETKEISTNIGPDLSVQSDCIVVFPNKSEEIEGNTQFVKKRGRYTDIDVTSTRKKLITNVYTRTDTHRVFGAGTCSAIEFFLTKNKLETLNPIVGYEQGLVSAWNMLSLRIPFQYVPFEVTTNMGKKLLFAGNKVDSDSYVIEGSLEKWDFIVYYGCGPQVMGVAASPSRQKEFQIYRQALRLGCQPLIEKVAAGEWEKQNLQKLIRKINKSGCYRGLIHDIEEKPEIKEVLWAERNKGVGFVDDSPLKEDEPELDQHGYKREIG